jgi:hypothetical protein
MHSIGRDRRLVDRFPVNTPLRVRAWKSVTPEEPGRSLNISQRGMYFATDALLREGETVEVFFNMPEEVAGEAPTEWRCTGHVVRVEKIEQTGGRLGVGVQFDCYEVSRSKPMDTGISIERPMRMFSEIVP